MLYIKRFTKQDNRIGGGGSNTLVSAKSVTSGFFPEPKEFPEEIELKFIFPSVIVSAQFGYSGAASTEIRIKSFVPIISAIGIIADIGDIAIFRKKEDEEDTYYVIIIKDRDPDYTFFSTLFGSPRDNHKSPEILIDEEEDDSLEEAGINEKVPYPNNWLIYGAPGTGKSRFIDSESGKYFLYRKRITFYPDYSYSKFVGSYKPTTFYKFVSTTPAFHETKVDSDPHPDGIRNEPIIDYSFVPGPFLETLTLAYKGLSLKKNFLLIIEELNRANAASVFGEVFQLLDRKNGNSEYRVRLSKEAMLYVAEELTGNEFSAIREDIIKNGLYIPSNLYIWATMNSADQGVFPLDSAFKRRWTPYFMPLNQNEGYVPAVELNFAGEKYQWNLLRKALNKYLADVVHVAEDRLIAPFFIGKEELLDENNLNETFKNKLLLYLRDDVLRHKKGFFKPEITTFSAIHENFANKTDSRKSYDFFAIISDTTVTFLKTEYSRLLTEINLEGNSARPSDDSSLKG